MDYSNINELLTNRAPVSHSVVKDIQKMILDGKLKPGEKLPSQREFAKWLGIGRSSLREALMMLETLGFLRIIPGKGTYVSTVNPSSTGQASEWRFQNQYSEKDVFQTRLFLETNMVRLVGEVIDKEALDALKESTQKMESYWKEQDLLSVAENDIRFHSIIVQTCPNKMLSDLYQNIRNILTETQRHPIPITRPDRIEESLSEHRQIHEALSQKNGEAARDIMSRHIIKTARELDIYLD